MDRPASSKLRAPRPHQAGVGLIEVLVAVLVLSLGVLGIAALQTRALSNNGSTMALSMATVASYSILEAMRADKTSALGGSYSGTIAANSCPAAGTSQSSWVLNNWCTKQLAAYLPAVSSTTAVIACTAANGSCTVTIQFDDSRAGGSATQQVKTTAGL